MLNGCQFLSLFVVLNVQYMEILVSMNFNVVGSQTMRFSFDALYHAFHCFTAESGLTII